VHTRPPAGPIRTELMAKPGGGVRRLTHLSRADDVRFRRLVARVVPEIERSSAATVFANRAGGGTRPAALAPWRPAHRAWRRAVGGAMGAGGSAIATDVADCYASITPDAVGRALARAGAGGERTDALVAWLRALEPFGVTGLPIGPEPSALLANVVLSAGDVALDAAGVRWFRWVDDWVLVADAPSPAEGALGGLARALERDGLTLRDRKTRRWRDARDAVDARAAPEVSDVRGAVRRQHVRDVT